jgi:methyl-accepting chemotaxis protein
MRRRRFKLRIKLNIYILSVATIIYCITIGYISYRLKEITYSNSVEIVKGSTREYQNKISEELNVMMESARTMKNAFQDYPRQKAENRDQFYDNLLTSNLAKHPEYLSVGVYWELKALDKTYKKKNGRFWNGFFREGDKIVNQKAVEDTTNQELTSTYYQVRKMNKETIVNPYYDQTTKEMQGILMTSLLTPIQDEAGQFVGMIGIDISLSHMNQLISRIKPYKEATSYIISENRIVVAHSNTELTGKNFISSLAADSAVFLNEAFNNQLTSNTSFTYRNYGNGKEFLVSFEPITINNQNTKWVIGVEVPTAVILEEAQNVLIKTVIAGLIGLLLLYVTIYFIAIKISDPIVKGVEFAKSIASGNLNTQLTIVQNDEIGDLAESLSMMSSKLTTILSQIIQSSDTIAESSLELLDSSVKMADGANNQAASSEEISTSMELMLSRIQQNNRNALETEKIAIKAAKGIQEGNESTLALIQSMNNIVQRISIVGEIAKQTNLLAINAAIEASRYGMQGKGFAVVAAEIKKLAERSQLAAKEINELSNHGLLQAKITGDKLQEIIPDIEHTAVLVQQIALSSIDQKISSEEINQGIQQLNKVTQQNAEASFELSINSKSISKQAANLKKLISYFKIEGLN